MRPFALEIYERYCDGSTVEELSIEFQIPADRIAKRIRVAEQYLRLAARTSEEPAPRRMLFHLAGL